MARRMQAMAPAGVLLAAALVPLAFPAGASLTLSATEPAKPLAAGIDIAASIVNATMPCPEVLARSAPSQGNADTPVAMHL
jgi:hypothetical protein